MNRTVGIAGLGLIGGSLALALKARTGFRVLGCDRDEAVMKAAAEQGAVDGALTEENTAECGIVIAALYPGDTIAFCERNLSRMSAGSILVDCSGVKARVCSALSAPAKERGIRFVGGHPMAGVERSGFSNAFAELFAGATMILCKDENTDPGALEELETFFLLLGFGGVKISTADEHDEIIAYTSQLAHLVSSAYIQSDTVKRRYGFSAGSFKDLTRVAKLNKDMWAALFFENKANLLKETDAFIAWIMKYRNALAGDDIDRMRELLGSGSARKINDEEEERLWLTR